MKKIVLTALLFAGLATAGFSQDRQPREKKSPEERAQHMTDALSQKLSLTESQKKDVYKINLERANNMEKLHASKEKRNKKDMAEAKKLFDASDDKLNKVLNEEQRKTYAQLKTDRKDKVKEHKGEFRKRSKERKGEAK